MKKLLIFLIFILLSNPCLASTYGFGFVSFSATTGIGGSATVSVPVPGTFGGLNPNDPSQGRYLKNAMIWCDSPSAGDELSLLQVVDTDGVVPAPARAAFPNYPVIFDLLDTVTGLSPALFIPSSGFLAEAFDATGSPMTRFIPSQLYIKATYQAGGLGIAKTMRIVLRWGILQ